MTSALKTLVAMLCTLYVVGGAEEVFARGGYEVILTPSEMLVGWRTAPNSTLARHGQPLRVAGEMTQLIRINEGSVVFSGYCVVCNGMSIPVVVGQGGGQSVLLPTRDAVFSS